MSSDLLWYAAVGFLAQVIDGALGMAYGVTASSLLLSVGVPPATASAAEDFVVPLHASKRATIIGERTFGSTGQPLQIGLPGGGHARICTKRDIYPDGREFVGVGVIPDIEVHPTAADIATDRDVILKKAIQLWAAPRHSN